MFIPADCVYVSVKEAYGENINSDYDICFNYVYTGREPDIYLVGIDDYSLSPIACESVTSDFEENVKVSGYKLGAACVNFEPETFEDGLEISKLQFKVGDEVFEVKCDSPWTITTIAENTDDSLQPMVVMSSGGEGSIVDFEWEAERPVTITSFELSEGLSINDLTVTVEDESGNSVYTSDKIENVSLEEGYTYVVTGTLHSDLCTGYQNVYGNSSLKYTESGKEYEEINRFYFDAVSNESETEDAIKAILEHQE